jgi:16S rRNA C967 or C1407 C5-methylase (RsmB/RsmF family)
MRGRFTAVRDAVVNEVVVPIGWCRGAWQINCDSATLAKDDAFSPLHSLLTREVGLSHIVRQELVSMIPAILLDPQHFHNTLDMCAAPGSKTEQLISRVCCRDASSPLAGTESRDTPSSSPRTEISSGLVVANDADPKRLATLRRRYETCRYPNLVFTCATADCLQQILDTNLSFHRVLCDVPCTGDGTFRKSPHLWRLFRPRFAAELHPLQLDIARCGVRLMTGSLSEGKSCRLVYSTCSLNPIEDEAVVAALVMEFWREGINLRLADPSSLLCDDSSPLLAHHLPGIRWRPGVSCWASDVEIMLAGEADPKEREDSRQRLPPLTRSMSCPQSEEMKKELCLERCMRILPQDMNTGGFFIAVLELSSDPLPVSFREALRAEDDLRVRSESLIADPNDLRGAAKQQRKKRPVDSLEHNQLTGEKKLRSMQTFQALGYNPHTAPQERQVQQASE